MTPEPDTPLLTPASVAFLLFHKDYTCTLSSLTIREHLEKIEAEVRAAHGSEQIAEEAEDFISKLEQTLSDMAPLYHETAVSAESDLDDLHPAVTWDRCPDPLCARARALLVAALEAEWYNGNLDEKAYRRLCNIVGDEPYPSAILSGETP